jgi:hypothetical protein
MLAITVQLVEMYYSERQKLVKSKDIQKSKYVVITNHLRV